MNNSPYYGENIEVTSIHDSHKMAIAVSRYVNVGRTVMPDLAKIWKDRQASLATKKSPVGVLI